MILHFPRDCQDVQFNAALVRSDKALLELANILEATRSGWQSKARKATLQQAFGWAVYSDQAIFLMRVELCVVQPTRRINGVSRFPMLYRRGSQISKDTQYGPSSARVPTPDVCANLDSNFRN